MLQRIVAKKRVIAVVVVVLALAFVTLQPLYRVIVPPERIPSEADAALVFAGGSGERLEVADEFFRSGVVDAIAVNRAVGFDSSAGDAVRAYCDRFEETETGVHCLVALPDSTKGEAQSFASLAEEMGWESVLVVSSDHHLARAVMWVDRCFDGEVFSVAATARTKSRQVRHEWLALLHGHLLDRSC